MTDSPPPQSAPLPGLPDVPLIGLARLDAMSTGLARNWWLVALRGAIAILFGVVAFVAPGAFVLSLVLFFSAYMLVDGLFAIAAAMRAASRDERWGLLLLEGLFDIAIGIAAFLVPAAAVWAFVYLVAFWALVSGGLMLTAAFRLHRHYGRWWLALGGAISALFGIALLINPGMSALVLTWWLGGYAIAFGALLLLLGFALRGRHAEAGRTVPPAGPALPVGSARP